MEHLHFALQLWLGAEVPRWWRIRIGPRGNLRRADSLSSGLELGTPEGSSRSSSRSSPCAKLFNVGALGRGGRCAPRPWRSLCSCVNAARRAPALLVPVALARYHSRWREGVCVCVLGCALKNGTVKGVRPAWRAA